MPNSILHCGRDQREQNKSSCFCFIIKTEFSGVQNYQTCTTETGFDLVISTKF